MVKASMDKIGLATHQIKTSSANGGLGMNMHVLRRMVRSLVLATKGGYIGRKLGGLLLAMEYPGPQLDFGEILETLSTIRHTLPSSSDQLNNPDSNGTTVHTSLALLPLYPIGDDENVTNILVAISTIRGYLSTNSSENLGESLRVLLGSLFHAAADDAVNLRLNDLTIMLDHKIPDYFGILEILERLTSRSWSPVRITIPNLGAGTLRQQHLSDSSCPSESSSPRGCLTPNGTASSRNGSSSPRRSVSTSPSYIQVAPRSSSESPPEGSSVSSDDSFITVGSNKGSSSTDSPPLDIYSSLKKRKTNDDDNEGVEDTPPIKKIVRNKVINCKASGMKYRSAVIMFDDCVLYAETFNERL